MTADTDTVLADSVPEIRAVPKSPDLHDGLIDA
jgi:hypothetical protein